MELNEENLKKAFCEVLYCTGLGAAQNNCEELMEKNVLETVPESQHETYPDELLACTIRICTKDPYNWTVEESKPEIDSEMTFYLLWYNWIIEIISN